MTIPNDSQPVAVALTGASGFQYGFRLIQCLVAAKRPVWVMISKAAQVVAATETDLKLPGDKTKLEAHLTDITQAEPGQIQVFGREQWMAPVASGSGREVPLVICPCSTGTVSAVATGASNNLIERAADVALKERRPLIMVVREMPLSTIHLENMLKLSQMGAVMMPASPGFYQNPESVEEMIDFVVARILNQLNIEHRLLPKWGEENS